MGVAERGIVTEDSSYTQSIPVGDSARGARPRDDTLRPLKESNNARSTSNRSAELPEGA
jgi:hypothetical protein